MKKMLTLALVALGFTAAQAVSIMWNDNNGFDLGNKAPGEGSSAKLKISIIGPAAISGADAAVDFVGAAEGKTIFSFAGITLAKRPPRVGYNENNFVSLLTFGSSEPNYVGGHISNERLNGSAPTVFEIDLTNYNSTTKTWTATVTTVEWSNGTSSSNGEFLSNKAFSYDALTSTNKFTSDLGFTSYGIYLEGEFETVPEPTALALLALGVAGLALKRKVA